MRDLRWLYGFVRPYRREALLSLATLAALVVLDLAIPRLVQRIVDDGIARQDRATVVRTAIEMLAISVVSTFTRAPPSRPPRPRVARAVDAP